MFTFLLVVMLGFVFDTTFMMQFTNGGMMNFSQPLIPTNVNMGFAFMDAPKQAMPTLELDLTIDQVRRLWFSDFMS